MTAMATSTDTSPDGELEYWRALAEERQRQLVELRALVLAAIDGVPDAHVRAFVSALDASRPAWIRELDSMEAALRSEPSNALTELDDLWRRVAADSGQ